MFSNEKVATDSIGKFYCEFCDYVTSRKFNFEKHKLTSKHLQAMGNKNLAINVVNCSTKKYKCDCGKEYCDNSGLWRHKKRCSTSSNNNEIKKDKTLN